ncbi:MAG: helix-turn-helix domain-containing protein [Ruminiclostridium sp.]
MAYTKFGEFMRLLRVKHHEVMGDVAKLLGVSTPFLSAVENGKKNVPVEWFDKIAEHYALDKEQITEMKESAEMSKTQIKIALSQSQFYQREAALQFARSFDDIDEETAAKILELLKRSGNV